MCIRDRIIFDDADIPAAANAALWAIFANSGQNCVAGSRLYVQDRVYDAVQDALASAAPALKIGQGLDTGTQLGPLISQTQLDRVMHYVDAGVRDGAALITGGAKLDGAGYFMQPTIFGNVADDALIAAEEIFGPVLTVFRFNDESEAVARANSSKFGLAAGVWTRDLSRAHRLARTLNAGVVWVNTYDWFDPSVPFGGVGQSGYGRELGRQVMEMYTELKSVWVKL